MSRNTRKFVDFDPSFEAHPTTGDLLVRTEERAIKFAVKSLVLTNTYERLFRPEMGTNINSLLFENFDDMVVIVMKQAVTEILTEFEPRITVLDVDVNPSLETQSIYINISFAIKNTDKPLDVSVVLERTR